MTLMVDYPSFVFAEQQVTDATPRRARIWGESVLDRAAKPEPEYVVWLTMLAISELVTNALRHANGAVRVTVTLLPGCIEIAAADRGHRMTVDPAALAVAAETDEHHRGLAILAQLTAGVSVREAPGWAKEVTVLVLEEAEPDA